MLEMNETVQSWLEFYKQFSPVVFWFIFCKKASAMRQGHSPLLSTFCYFMLCYIVLCYVMFVRPSVHQLTFASVFCV